MTLPTRTVSMAVVAMAFLLALVRAADHAAIVGAWDCVSSASSGDDQTFTLTVTEEDGKPAAAITNTSFGDVAVSDFKAEGNEASFTAQTGGDTYAVKLTVNGSKLEGTFEGANGTGTIKGTKKS